jgi:hypothetical protein
MKKICYTIIGLLGITLFACFNSCQKDIEVDLPVAEEKLVIEGAIDLTDYPMVFLTKNEPYFGSLDSAQLAGLLVTDAKVIVNNGTITDTLGLTFSPDYFPPIFFKGTKFKGEAGKTYSLKVIYKERTYTATTTIPMPVPLDSVWFMLEPNQDSLGYLWATFTDPEAQGNYYRLFSKRFTKDHIFIPILGSAYDDKMFNGQEFKFSMMRGSNNLNSTVEDPELGYYKIGDSIVVKACSIDRDSYNFWRTAEGEIYGGSNPFMTPVQIATNIQGGGLGVWAGYGCSFDTVIAK